MGIGPVCGVTARHISDITRSAASLGTQWRGCQSSTPLTLLMQYLTVTLATSCPLLFQPCSAVSAPSGVPAARETAAPSGSADPKSPQVNQGRDKCYTGQPDHPGLLAGCTSPIPPLSLLETRLPPAPDAGECLATSAEERWATQETGILNERGEAGSSFVFLEGSSRVEGRELAEGTWQRPARPSGGNRRDYHTGCWARGFWEGWGAQGAGPHRRRGQSHLGA